MRAEEQFDFLFFFFSFLLLEHFRDLENKFASVL